MKSLLKRRVTPAFVVAMIALFVSLGGVSYGVATGSIDGREIKNNSVTGKDLKRRSLDGTDIKINRVGGNAVKEEGLESSKIGKVPAPRPPTARPPSEASRPPIWTPVGP